MGSERGRIRVALVSTAAQDVPGSMRAYAETVMEALVAHAPEFAPELLELDPRPARGAWGQRLQTLLMPARAWLQRGRSPAVWHVLDGSRAYVARALGPAPTVVTVHDVIPWLQARGRFPGAPPVGAAASALWRANGREYRRAGRLVCVSENTARDVRTEFGCDSGRTQVVANPLRPSMARQLSPPGHSARGQGVVLHVGNNGFYKNRAGVLRIFARLDPGLARRLVMAGPAPSESLLRTAHELGLEGRLEWVGNADDATLARLYRESSVLLFPSIYEGFGWPVLEAMAFGLPVVASDAGSLPEVAGAAVDGFRSDDEDGIALAIGRLLSSPELAEASSRRGLERAKLFSMARFAQQMREAYSAAIAQGPCIS